MENTFELVRTAYKALDEKFGIDITVLNVEGVTVLAEYFIIASANNSTQLRAMAENVSEKLCKSGARLKHSEGYQKSNWILLDFSDIIIHLFTKDEREFYDLERIWRDADGVEAHELAAETLHG